MNIFNTKANFLLGGSPVDDELKQFIHISLISSYMMLHRTGIMYDIYLYTQIIYEKGKHRKVSLDSNWSHRSKTFISCFIKFKWQNFNLSNDAMILMWDIWLLIARVHSMTRYGRSESTESQSLELKFAYSKSSTLSQNIV